MDDGIQGIHHVTAIASDPQRNVDFYTSLLGLRLVKKTVNFDDPGIYHLYFGDELGRPGTILTFFPMPGARRGSRGVGQATTTAFSVPPHSLAYWQDRLRSAGITCEESRRRYDEEVLTLLDPDGLKLELVAHGEAADLAAWPAGPIPEPFAVRGFHGVTLEERDADATAEFLQRSLGFVRIGADQHRLRFVLAGEGPGRRVDVVVKPDAAYGTIAAGTVHHVAWRVACDDAELAWRERLQAEGWNVSPVMDRQYFRSIYFREPGGVLFEIATDQPGFTRDEPVETLGADLKLPPWLEAHRQDIEALLPAIEVPESLLQGGTA